MDRWYIHGYAPWRSTNLFKKRMLHGLKSGSEFLISKAQYVFSFFSPDEFTRHMIRTYMVRVWLYSASSDLLEKCYLKYFLWLNTNCTICLPALVMSKHYRDISSQMWTVDILGTFFVVATVTVPYPSTSAQPFSGATGTPILDLGKLGFPCIATFHHLSLNSSPSMY